MESPIPEGHPDHRKYKNAPHPYIIVPPLTRKRYFSPDDSISFDILLIGKANDYLPYFIYTFTEMGKRGIGKDRGKFDIASVEALSLDGTKTEIFNSNTGILKAEGFRIGYNYFISLPSPNPHPAIITLSFETPVRIKVNERLSSEIPFNLLITRLSERAFLLAEFYCGAETCGERSESIGDLKDFLEVSENVETVNNRLRWVDWERYSTRQKARMKFGGWIGDVTYKGDLQKFLPLLRLGEHIHVGKATTFGLGKYRMRS